MRNRLCVAVIAGVVAMAALPVTALAQTDNPARNKRVTLNLENADLKYAVKMLFSSAGINFTLDPAAAGTVTLSLSDVPFKTALESILRSTQNSNPLTYRVEDGIYNIFPRKEEKPDLVIDVPTAQPPKNRIAKVNLNFADVEDITKALGGTFLKSRFGGNNGNSASGNSGINGFGSGFNSSNGFQGGNGMGLGSGSGFNNFGSGFNSGTGSGVGSMGSNNGSLGRRR